MMGIAMGMYITVCPIFISEISPPSLTGPLGCLNQLALVSGLIIAFSVAFIMPLPDDQEALTTRLWRIIFILPAIFAITQVVLFIFIFKYDSPQFYKKIKNTVKYHKVMSLIYKDYSEEAEKNIGQL